MFWGVTESNSISLYLWSTPSLIFFLLHNFFLPLPHPRGPPFPFLRQIDFLLLRFSPCRWLGFQDTDSETENRRQGFQGVVLGDTEEWGRKEATGRGRLRKGAQFLSDKESVVTVALFMLKLQEIQILSVLLKDWAVAISRIKRDSRSSMWHEGQQIKDSTDAL